MLGRMWSRIEREKKTVIFPKHFGVRIPVTGCGNNHINGNRLLPQANRRTKIIFRSLHDDYAIHLFSSLDFFGLLYVYRTHYQWYA